LRQRADDLNTRGIDAGSSSASRNACVERIAIIASTRPPGKLIWPAVIGEMRGALSEQEGGCPQAG